MSRHTERAAAWAAAQITDCIPEAVCGRADPDRGGRHQHSLRDLDGCAAGDGSGGPRAAAPLIEAPRPPLYAPARGQRLAPPRGAGRHEGELPPLAADGDAGLVLDALTGIAVLSGDGAAGSRAEEVRGIQALAGGVRPGDCDLAGALVRRAGRSADAATLASLGAALWEITACGDMGSQPVTVVHQPMRDRPRGLPVRARSQSDVGFGRPARRKLRGTSPSRPKGWDSPRGPTSHRAVALSECCRVVSVPRQKWVPG